MRSLAYRGLRWIYRSLLPPEAKSTLRMRLLLEERDRPPTRIERFEARSVLVLAPHMDDEVIGCGGALRRHVLAGARVVVAFLTDGAAQGQELAEVRKAESRRAAEILGLHEQVYLDEPDGALASGPDVAQRLREVLERVQAEVLYLPSMLDTHADHWATNLILERCLGVDGRSLAATRLRQYEVWTPLIVNAVADIGDVVEDKQRALREFRSQLERTDLVHVTTALNQYRSIYLEARRGYAEAFYESDVDEYRHLLARYRERRR